MKIMRTVNRLIISMSISTFFFTSCTNDIEMAEDDIQMMHTAKVTLNANKLDFDASSTRSLSTDWGNGDIVYLRFYTSNGIVVGNATYDESRDWIVTYFGTLDRNSEMQVEITFFDDSSLKTVDDIVYFTENTAIYQDIQGKYTYISSDELFITATLKPLTSRIRFKGEVDEYIEVGGLEIYSSYDVHKGIFTTSNNFVGATVNKSGYTDYIYGICSDKTTPQIKINKQEEDYWSYLYTLNCTENMMLIGKSGWMNIPTPMSRNGWTMKQVFGEENGHLWVDLGLPSGTIWADENIGADIAQWQADEQPSNVYGNSYNWGQTSWRSGCMYENTDIQGDVDYDTAKDQLGGRWIMPSKADYEELLNYCTLINHDNAYGSISAIEIRGTTGMRTYLPYDVWVSRYWTSTPSEVTETVDYINGEFIDTTHKNAWTLYVHTSNGTCELTTGATYNSASESYYSGYLRAVIKP